MNLTKARLIKDRIPKICQHALLRCVILTNCVNIKLQLHGEISQDLICSIQPNWGHLVLNPFIFHFVFKVWHWMTELSKCFFFFFFFLQMSDVEAGGATVFPDFGAAIWPRKVEIYIYRMRRSFLGDIFDCKKKSACRWVWPLVKINRRWDFMISLLPVWI